MVVGAAVAMVVAEAYVKIQVSAMVVQMNGAKESVRLEVVTIVEVAPNPLGERDVL